MNQQDRAFCVSCTAVIGILVLLAVGIFFVAGSIAGGDQAEADRTALQLQASKEHIAPVATAMVAGSEAASAEAEAEQAAQAANAESAAVATAAAEAVSWTEDDLDLAKGKEVYAAACQACHNEPGVPNAPKFGDKVAWEPRLEKGWETLVNNVLQGFNAMPAKGMGAHLPDGEIVAALGYVLDASR